MKLTDEIRRFVADNYFELARKNGDQKVILLSGEVHDRMKLKNRMPAVCSVLRGSKLQDLCRFILIREIRMPTVEKDSSTNKFVYRIE